MCVACDWFVLLVLFLLVISMVFDLLCFLCVRVASWVSSFVGLGVMCGYLFCVICFLLFLCVCLLIVLVDRVLCWVFVDRFVCAYVCYWFVLCALFDLSGFYACVYVCWCVFARLRCSVGSCWVVPFFCLRLVCVTCYFCL